MASTQPFAFPDQKHPPFAVGQSSENLILGPTLTVGKKFFDKKLRTNFSGSYNTTFANGEQSNSIFNLRLGGNYVLRQRHNLSFNALSLFNTTTTETRTDLTLTFGYTHTLGKPRVNPSGQRPPVQAMEKGPRLRFRYRVTTFSGTLNEINDQLMNVYQSPAFARIPQAKKKDLDLLYKETTVQAKPSDYKERALFFLEELYASADFMKTYDFNLFMALQELGSDMQNSDLGLEDNVDKQAKRIRQLTQDKADGVTLNKARADYKAAKDKWDIHLWVARELANYATRASVWGEAGHLAEFNDAYADTIFKKFYSGDERMYDLLSFMKIRLAEFFVAKARVTLKIDQDEE